MILKARNYRHRSGTRVFFIELTDIAISASEIRALVKKVNRFGIWCLREWKIISKSAPLYVDGAVNGDALAEISSWDKALLLTRFALEKKACDLVVMEVHELTSIADYFIVVLRALRSPGSEHRARDRRECRREGVNPFAVEGTHRGHWVLMDFSDVIVHIFYEPVREFYDLDGLWGHAPRAELPEPYSKFVDSFRAATNSFRSIANASSLDPTRGHDVRRPERKAFEHDAARDSGDLGWIRHQSEKRGQCHRQRRDAEYRCVLREFPNSSLSMSGVDVGLPEGQMGNSEVGHMILGAGRIVYQDLTLIHKDIDEGNFIRIRFFSMRCARPKQRATGCI